MSHNYTYHYNVYIILIILKNLYKFFYSYKIKKNIILIKFLKSKLLKQNQTKYYLVNWFDRQFKIIIILDFSALRKLLSNYNIWVKLVLETISPLAYFRNRQ